MVAAMLMDIVVAESNFNSDDEVSASLKSSARVSVSSKLSTSELEWDDNNDKLRISLALLSSPSASIGVVGWAGS